MLSAFHVFPETILIHELPFLKTPSWEKKAIVKIRAAGKQESCCGTNSQVNHLIRQDRQPAHDRPVPGRDLTSCMLIQANQRNQSGSFRLPFHPPGEEAREIILLGITIYMM
jgi:hypothetical protein